MFALPFLASVPWRLVGKIAILIGCFIAGYYVASKIYKAEILELTTQYQNKFIEAEKLAETKRLDLEGKISVSESEKYKQLTGKQNEINALRDDVAASRKRLRLNAQCVNTGNQNSSTGSGVGNATAPELAREAEQNYFALLEDLNLMQKQLEACQVILQEERKVY